MEPSRVSERYLIFQRTITFLDEWLLYGLLLYLFVNDHIAMMALVAVVGGSFILHSYQRQWAMEQQRFGLLWKSESESTQEIQTSND